MRLQSLLLRFRKEQKDQERGGALPRRKKCRIVTCIIL